jgi:hypothetical protein
MELPEELLSIVREFSKPLLRYPREYKQAMRTLKRDEWPLVKRYLSTSEADQGLPVLKTFVDAFVARKAAVLAYDTYCFKPSYISCPVQDLLELQERWDDLNRLRNVYRDSLAHQERTYRVLMLKMLDRDVVHMDDLAYVSDEYEEVVIYASE